MSTQIPQNSSRRVLLISVAGPPDPFLTPTAELLKYFGVETVACSLGRLPGGIPDFSTFARDVANAGADVVVVASHAAAEVRALAAAVSLPVIRVPIARPGAPDAALLALQDNDDAAAGDGSFATVALGTAGATNAALLAVSILALTDDRLCAAWMAYRQEQTNIVLAQPPPSG